MSGARDDGAQRERLAEVFSGLGVVFNIGLPFVVQARGEVSAAPWPVQLALWALFIVPRADPVQRWLGGGALDRRNGRRTALGCLVGTVAVCAAGVPELAAAVCGLVVAVHLQWQHRRALQVGGLAAASLVLGVIALEHLGLVQTTSGSVAPYLSLAALGYSLSVVGNLALLAAAQERSRVALAHEQELRAELLRQVAELDDLTGLLSRRGLGPHLERAAAAAAPGRATGVLFCDVDRFKAVNDQHGHAAGDALLREVAARLSAAVRGSDVVGRLGGDEFVVVATGLAGDEGLRVLRERLRAVLSQPYVIDGTALSCGVSIGAWSTEVPTAVEDLLGGADAAMYAAKRSTTR